MQLANRILEILYDQGGRFVLLADLASAGGGRQALERALEGLAARGHRLERSPVGGVRLLRPTVLDAHLIQRDLPVQRIGRHVICFGEVSSTNDVAFDSAARGSAEPLVVAAEFQRAGRGRLGRSWISPPGAGILASVALGARENLSHEALTVAAGLAVAEGIEQAAGVAAGLEWPNDVVLEGKKLAGVMVEVRGAGQGSAGRRTVVGFGINVAAAPPPQQAGRATACLAEVAADPPALERIEILRAVLVRLDRWIAAIGAGKDQDLHDRWLARCAMLNRRVRVACGGREFTGRVADVSPLQGLVLLTDGGRQVRLPAATSSIVR